MLFVLKTQYEKFKRVTAIGSFLSFLFAESSGCLI